MNSYSLSAIRIKYVTLCHSCPLKSFLSFEEVSYKNAESDIFHLAKEIS